MTEPTIDPRQLGDATVLRARIRGIASADTITIHRARKHAIRIDLASKDDLVRSAVSVDDLPELIHTLIARSGRADLALVVTEPEPEPAHEEQPTDVPACGDCGRLVCQCPTVDPAPPTDRSTTR